MSSRIGDVWRRLRRDEGGNVAMLFGATAIPILLIMGGAIDVARFSRYKADLANAVDSASLALAKNGEDFDEEEAEEYVKNHVAALNVPVVPTTDDPNAIQSALDQEFVVTDFDVTKQSNGFLVDADASMKTYFLPLGSLASTGGGLLSMGMDVTAAVVHSSNQLEIALVFDNTGSMNCGATVSSSCSVNWSNPGTSSRIVALKAAAHTLVDTLMSDDTTADHIKIGLVPFEGTVNIGSTYAATPPTWVDWSDQAKAKYTGRNFDSYNFGGATGTQRVGHKWLFNKLTAKDSAVKWEGCVEMRAEPYDILDTVPSTATPDTLFAPFFWPDEPDDDNDNDRFYPNNYLNDKLSGGTAPATAQKSLTKFTSSTQAWHSGKKDTSFPFESGPNRGCPKPIVPLTSTKATIEAAIDGMVAYGAMGTFIPVGLVWGWHILSSTEPFTQGMAPSDDDYDKTVKAIVLLSDGENSITTTATNQQGSNPNHNVSYFSGYNYTALQVSSAYRLGSSSVSTATANMDKKLYAVTSGVESGLCKNVKDAGIRLYTITFGSISEDTKTLMRNCASKDDGTPLFYDAPSTTDLEEVFQEIGEDLSEIHLAM